MPSIFWFRRDLRLTDNIALWAAVTAGRGDVVGVFVIDPDLLASVGPARAHYLRATLQALTDSMDGALCVRVGQPGAVLAAVAQSVGATTIFATGDFSPQGQQRDHAVANELAPLGITVSYRDSPYVVPPGTVVTKMGTPSKVFTPFRRYWELEPRPAPLAAPDVQWISLDHDELDELLVLSGRHRPEYFGDLPDTVPAFDARVGEVGAWATLESFLSAVPLYDEQRNTPGIEGTSRLSPHLRFGTIHPRQILARTDGASRGSEVFRSEIAWREFYADVLYHHPDSTWRVLQSSLEQLEVDTDEAAVARFQTWARGETGYPLVDAGMRQLLHEGWMHNRVRMITASFLVKHLHLDWRWGAKWFMWRLIDGDVASNQHGWQWTAGTGTDASPFHRVFNPTLQAERFDPDGTYVRRWVPELRGVSAPQCLQPGGGDGLLRPASYPVPMVDANEERQEALARFARARGTA